MCFVCKCAYAYVYAYAHIHLHTHAHTVTYVHTKSTNMRMWHPSLNCIDWMYIHTSIQTSKHMPVHACMHMCGKVLA